jgi:hypothetical protein
MTATAKATLAALTVVVLQDLLKEAQEHYCHEDFQTGDEFEFAESYGRYLEPKLGLPAREIENVMKLAKVQHTVFEDTNGPDPDWSKWYAEFALPYFQAPATEGDNSQF